MGGSGAASSTGGMGGDTGPCGTDCSVINTPQCQVAQCNVQTGQCEVVNDEEGVACDDGLFCTISDSCSAGSCIGGPQNDCGMAPPQCTEVSCDESSQTCSTAPAMDGSTCQDPNDLCLKGSTCSNGNCIGGSAEDCFFFPVPSDCHVASCNPNNGMCEAVVGNEGQACNDPNDLCTVDKTCATGVCQGGTPKDCSQLTQGCFNGVCDTLTGQCQQVAVMPGGMCQDAADDCNNGVCDTMGMCNPVPTNNGGMCDDGNGCSTGTTCSNGQCLGGTTVTACINNDGCCPGGCTLNNDNDCFTEWSSNFTSGMTPSTQQCQDFATWRQTLTGTYNGIRIYGSADTTGLTCANTAAVAQIVNGLLNLTSFDVTCDGNQWTYCATRYAPAGEFWVNPPSLCSGNNCPNPGYLLRPCIGNSNYGGVGTPTCSPPTQTMALQVF
jgi:hypothetical protein